MSRIRMPQNTVLRVLAYLGLAFAGIAGLWRVEGIANDANDASTDAQSAVEAVSKEQGERNVAICEATNLNRKVIIQLVESTVSNSGGGRDFTQIPGWDELDAATQNFFLNLTSDSNGGSERFVEAARELLAPQDCTALSITTTTEPGN